MFGDHVGARLAVADPFTAAAVFRLPQTTEIAEICVF